ncbi:hypothetical protein [Paenibacillus bovis]|uniref:hypothetical protein n=1 Tax=Paenibacillus bovis TaxID=1616788 RepID=UPI000B357D6B|nr:hypothetical protein [Paenibacillus bovis]
MRVGFVERQLHIKKKYEPYSASQLQLIRDQLQTRIAAIQAILLIGPIAILLIGYAIMMYDFPGMIMELSAPGEPWFFHVILYFVLPIGLLGLVCRWIWKKQCQYIYEKVVISHMINE